MKYLLPVSIIFGVLLAAGCGEEATNTATELADSQEAAPSQVTLERIGGYLPDENEKGAMEIGAYDAASKRLFTSDGENPRINIFDLSDPAAPALISSIDISQWGGGVNSVDVHDGLVAAAVENEVKTRPGKVVFFDLDGNFQTAIAVGALPDSLAFTPDGTRVIVANEGEPDESYADDPEGTISVLQVEPGEPMVDVSLLSTITFNALQTENMDPAVRIVKPGARPAVDFEPEFVGVSPDSSTAVVSLQENNGIAVINAQTGQLRQIFGLKYIDYRLEQNAFDASDADGGINMKSWPVIGIPMPDAVAAFSVDGQMYVVAAHEGDSRDYEGWSEEARVADVTLDPSSFSNADELQLDENLGRLKITTTLGTMEDGSHNVLFAFGGRSIGIYNMDGQQVWHSANDFERITAEQLPDHFNASNDSNEMDTRSDDKGPEPEGLVLGTIDGRTYCFVSLERIGGVMVYDITNPEAPEFKMYVNNRNFDADPATAEAGDLGPEGLVFIPAAESPDGENLLVVINEISGSFSVYHVTVQ